MEELFHEPTHTALKEAVHFLVRRNMNKHFITRDGARSQLSPVVMVLCCVGVGSGGAVAWTGVAVTMVVHNSLRLTVPYFSTVGKADPSKDRIITISTLRFLETPPVRTYPSILPGEFVCCWRNHAVIDMFAYSTNGSKFFIQVSLSPYRDHSTRLPHLFTHQIASATGYDTVYDFYSRCTDNSFRVGRN